MLAIGHCIEHLKCCFFQVGDVVLVKDETVMEADYRVIRLETLVS